MGNARQLQCKPLHGREKSRGAKNNGYQWKNNAKNNGNNEKYKGSDDVRLWRRKTGDGAARGSITRSARCGGTGPWQASIEITRFSSFVLFGGPASRPRFGRAPPPPIIAARAPLMRIGISALASFGRFWLRSGGFGFVRAVLASFGRFGFVRTVLASSGQLVLVCPHAVMPGRDGAGRTRPCLNRHFSSDRRGQQEHLVNINQIQPADEPSLCSCFQQCLHHWPRIGCEIFERGPVLIAHAIENGTFHRGPPSPAHPPIADRRGLCPHAAELEELEPQDVGNDRGVGIGECRAREMRALRKRLRHP